MAVSYRGASNAAGQNAGTTTSASTVSITPTLPASSASGDRVLVIQCASNTSGTTPANWTVLGTKDTIVGTGAVSAGGGQRYISVYYRDYDGVWTMPAFTLTSATQNSHWIGAVSLQKDASDSWDTPTISVDAEYFGTAGTAYSAVTGSSFTTHSAGSVIIGSVQNDSVTSTGGTLTQSGATFGAVTERCDGGTATGNDVSGTVHTCDVTTGAAATITFAKTLSAASQGGNVIIEQTVTTAPPPDWPVFVSTGTRLAGAASTTTNIAAPASVAADDIVLCFVLIQPYTGASGTDITVSTVPSGFTEAPNSPAIADTSAGSGTHVRWRVYWKRSTGGEPATYNFVLSATPNWRTGWAARYSGCITSGSPIDIDASAGGASATAHPNISLTTAGVNELLVWSVGSWSGYVTTQPTGFTKNAQGVTDDSDSGMCLASKSQVAAGLTGTLSATMDSVATVTARSVWLGALKPPGGAAPTGTIAAAAKKPTASASGVMQPQGSITAAVKKATAALSGKLIESGTISATTQKATASVSGRMEPKGTVGATAKKATASFVGAHIQAGTVAATIKKTIASLTGVEQPRGTVTVTARKSTASFTAAQIQTGVVVAAVKKTTTSLSGAAGLSPTGTISVAAKKATSSLAGLMLPRGAIAAAARKAAANLTAAQIQAATITATTRKTVAALTGVMVPAGTIVVTGKKTIAAFTAAHIQAGTIVAAAKKPTATLAGVEHPRGSVTVTIRRLVGSVSGGGIASGAAAATLKRVTAVLVGVEHPRGVIAATKSKTLAALGALQRQQGVVAVAAKKTAASLTGVLQPKGVLAGIAAKPRAVFTGKLAESGAVTVAARRPVFSAAGSGSGAPGNITATLIHTMGALTGGQRQTGAITVVMATTDFTGQGKQLQLGAMAAQIHIVTSSLTGALVPVGVITVVLEPSLFTAVGLGGFIEGPLTVTLRAAVFAAAHLVTPSANRTTVIAGEDRLTVIAGANRITVILGEDRLTIIENAARDSTTAGENRLTVIEAAKTLTLITA